MRRNPPKLEFIYRKLCMFKQPPPSNSSSCLPTAQTVFELVGFDAF